MPRFGNTDPQFMAVEEVFFAKNVKSALSLGQARGAVILAGVISGLSIHEYSALSIKQSVAGYGRAAKEQVAGMVQRLFRIDAAIEPNAADALAVAVCHISTHSSNTQMEDSGQVMIGFLEGKLRAKSPEYVIVDVHGVGYHVQVPLSTFYDLPELGHPVGLNIHTHVREDAIQLFGFRTMAEKEMFLLLTGVNGVGPKLAIGILSGISPDELRQVVVRQDYLRLKNIPGVGKKIADRRHAGTAGQSSRQEQGKGRTGPAFHGRQECLSGCLFSPGKSGLSSGRSGKSAQRLAGSLGENASLEDLLRGALKALA